MCKPSRYHCRLAAAGPLLAAALLLTGCSSEPPLLPPEITVTMRGHKDIEVADDGSLRPVVVSGRLGLCLQAPQHYDTSRWEAQLSFNDLPSASGMSKPAARIGRTLCFNTELPDSLPAGEAKLCGELVDRFDEQRFRIPCSPLRVQVDQTLYQELTSELSAVLADSQRSSEEMVRALDAVGDRAAAAGFPMLEVQQQLISVWALGVEGSPEAFTEAERRLDQLPPWLDQGVAASWGSLVCYERARLAQYQQQTEQAWRLLSRAQEQAERIAAPARLFVTMLQSDIVAEAGALREAIDRLRNGLQGCEAAPCSPRTLVPVRAELAWLIMTDPDASTEELTEAEALINAALAGPESDEPLERINQLINLGFLQTRLSRDHEQTLAEARSLLETAKIGDSRRRFLMAWAGLVDSLAALDAGKPETAQALCSAIAADPHNQEHPQLVAWASSCSGRAFRRSGNLERAANALQRAVALHLFATSQESAQRLPLGSSQVADDVYRAARIAVERGRESRAWTMLSQLDSTLADQAERQRCRRQVSDAEQLARWSEIAARQQELLGELVTLDLPASSLVRGSQEESLRRSLMEQLQELAREWPGCAERPEAPAETGTGFRAFALEDEIILLYRHPDGRVELAQRAALPRQQLRQLCDRLTQLLDERSADTETWRQLLQPLAAALVPRDRSLLGPVSSYSLHGLLQVVPVAALPIGDDGQGAERWLADLTTVVLRPAGVAGAPPAVETLASREHTPLFIVDPLSNLPSSRELLTTYRQLFPKARFLAGGEAGTGQLIHGLPDASWLHFDGHGHCDPAFPDLSSLSLADRPLVLIELAELPLPTLFANLSGCQTGRAPWTAGSGHYGIAGLLARRGVHWVVASRTTLDDRLALDFNRSFYRAAGNGAAIPLAYGEALARVRRTQVPAAWANLMLVQGGSGAPVPEGQNDPSATPK